MSDSLKDIKKTKLKRKADALNIGSYQRHVLFCGGKSCCRGEVGDQLWTHLKHRLAEIGFEHLPVYRTRVKCLRLCQGGPIMLIYPEGTWYAELDQHRIDRIIQEHLLDQKPVEEWIVANNPL